MAVYGTGTYGAGVYGVGGGTATLDPPTTVPVAGQPYVVTYFPALSNGTPVDVTSVDRVELYASPARTGSPVAVIPGPATRVAFGQYAFGAAVMPPAGTYFAVTVFTAAGVQQQDTTDTLTVYAFDGGFTAAGLVTLEEVKTYLRLEQDDRYDAELVRLIAVTTGHFARHGVSLSDTTVVDVGYGQPAILPVMHPTAVTVTDLAGATVTLPLRFTSAGLLYGLPPGSYAVTVTGRRHPEVVEAALITVQHAWETQRGAVPVPYDGATDETFTGRSSFFLPARAKELLRPYTTYTGIG